MRQLTTVLIGLTMSVILGNASARPLKVITTDTNLASIARSVGGDRVTVEALIRGSDDPHQIEPRPSMVVKAASADLFCRIGLDLDMWADAILERCGNRKVQRGGAGYVDCSRNVKVLEVPTTRLDPSMGDIHVYGNPHYLLDPRNGIVAASNIAAALIRVDPAHEQDYRARYDRFAQTMNERIRKWSESLKALEGQQVLVFHRNWIYFMTRFKLREFGAIEPKPGVPPSPGHVQGLIRSMKASNVRLVLCETFRSRRYPDLIARETGARVVYVPIAVEGEPGVNDYPALFDTIVNRLAAAP